MHFALEVYLTIIYTYSGKHWFSNASLPIEQLGLSLKGEQTSLKLETVKELILTDSPT